MGVYGLWRLIDAVGKQVPLEALEGKILAIDISIWIHQVLQGYQDSFGNPKPNAHLIGLFHRICKLLYYKIKPVFVFDGGVPILKQHTIALRRKQKSAARNKAHQMRIELINNLIKHSAVKTVLNTDKQHAASEASTIVKNIQVKPTSDDLFKLPDMPSLNKSMSDENDDFTSDSSDELSPRKQTKWTGNIHSVDVNSVEFKALPADVRYEILTDLKETRKQSSWGRLYMMPEESNEFSGFQMKRLLKRRFVQQSLESAEKEMGGKTLTLEELDKLLTEQGVTTNKPNCSYRIAGDNTTRLIYIKDKNEYIKNSNANSSIENVLGSDYNANNTDAGSRQEIQISDDINEYEFSDESSNDIEITDTNNFMLSKEMSSDMESELGITELQSLSEENLNTSITNPALSYMLEYSGLTDKQIKKIVQQSKKEAQKCNEQIYNKSEENHFCEVQNADSLVESSTCENVFENAVQSTQSSKTTFIATNAEKEVHVLPYTGINASNNVQGEIRNIAIISSTDTDSDEFIEVQDAPEVELDTTIQKDVPQQIVQIEIQTNRQIEEDIFADAFEACNPETNKLKNSQTVDNEKGNEKLHDIQIFQNKNVNVQSALEFKLNMTEVNIQLNNDVTENKSGIEASCDSEKISKELDVKNDVHKHEMGHKLSNTNPLSMDEEDLLSLQTQLENKQAELLVDIGKLERQGINISDQIQTEAQELLQLFGIPYIVAPMEAEAQCAYLEQIHLTDGTITDDSDVWLFGGQCVYKNFFDNNKKVLEFRLNDIQHHFKLTRNDMIQLALLVGSDYTTGLEGIGPVTALEILATFPSDGDDLLKGLISFCSWINNGRCAGPGKTGLRNKLQNLKIQKGFPSQGVAQAYLFPKVDESRETFSWGKINNVLLADYVKLKFGWDKDKYSRIIAPVLKRIEEKTTQKTIDAYFKTTRVPNSIEMALSKRVKNAVQRLNNEKMQKDTACLETNNSKEVRKTKPKSTKRKAKRTVGNEQIAMDSSNLETSDIPANNEKNGEEYLKCAETNQSHADTKSNALDSKGKTKNETKIEHTAVNSSPSKVSHAAFENKKNSQEYIPQREKDKANALKKKLHAIEILRKSKHGLYKTKKVKRCIRKVKQEAELSESDSSSS